MQGDLHLQYALLSADGTRLDGDCGWEGLKAVCCPLPPKHRISRIIWFFGFLKSSCISVGPLSHVCKLVCVCICVFFCICFCIGQRCSVQNWNKNKCTFCCMLGSFLSALSEIQVIVAKSDRYTQRVTFCAPSGHYSTQWELVKAPWRVQLCFQSPAQYRKPATYILG